MVKIYEAPQVAPVAPVAVQQNLRMSDRDAADISGATTLSQVSQETGAALDAYQKMRDREDEAKALEQSAALSTAVAQHHAELEQVKGADASTIGKKNEEFWRKYEDSALKDMTPSVREKFKPVLLRAKAASRESAIKAQVREENAYYDTTLAAGIDSATQAASLNPQDADNVKLNADLAKMYVGKQLKRRRLEGDAADAFVREQMSAFHVPVINGLIAKDVNAAKGYYYSNIKEINLASRAAIEKALETGGRAQLAQETADKLMSEFGDDEAAGLDYIQKNLSGEDEKVASLEYQARHADRRRLSAERQKKTLSTLALRIEEKGAGALTALTKTPEYNSLDDEHKRALHDIADTRAREARAEARAERAARQGGMTRTELRQLAQEQNYVDMVELARTDPEKFKSIDLNLHTSKLSSDMRKDLETMQRNMAEGGGKELTEAQILSSATDLAKAAGVKGGNLFKLRAAVREQVEVEQMATGKPLSRKRVREITNELLTEGKTEGLFFDSSTRRFAVPAGKPFIRKDGAKGARLLTDVPAADRDEIEFELRLRNRPVTAESILDLYNKGNAR